MTAVFVWSEVLAMEKLNISINASVCSQISASAVGMIGRGVKEVKENDKGELIFLMTDGREINLGVMSGGGPLPVATADVLGGIKVGENLKIKDGVLSVDTAPKVEQDNTKPVTSGAVHMEIGNIEVLLKAL